VDICIRGLPNQKAVSIRRRLDANFSLTCSWSVLGHFGRPLYVRPRIDTFPYDYNILTPDVFCSHFLPSRKRTLLVAKASLVPASFSLSLVCLSVTFPNNLDDSARVAVRIHLPLFYSAQRINNPVRKGRCKTPQLRDPTRLSNTSTYGAHLKGFASATLRGFGFPGLWAPDKSHERTVS
jgi:hypothetical protein